MSVTSGWLVDFRNVPNGSTVASPFFDVVGRFSAPRRFLLLGGTMSSCDPNPSNGHIRFELVWMDPNVPPGVVVWDRDIVRPLDGGQVGLELDLLSDAVGTLQPGPYFARIRCMGSAMLGPNDAFFVVAIDMDDGPSPFMSNPGVSMGRKPQFGAMSPRKRDGAGRPKPKQAKRKPR